MVFDSGRESRALCGEVSALGGGYDLVYLDPPYAPPRDDNCYIKRYHFLEGLSVYWRGQQIMQGTKTKKLVKKYTAFSYQRTVTQALRETIEAVLGEVKDSVEVRHVDHRYSFGTHATAQRREVSEYLFIGR